MREPGQRVLVVEDDRLIAADIENKLKKLGYVVVGNVASGEEAIRTSERLRLELVLMDVRLREAMDGVQVAKAIRDRFNVPVIYLTSGADEATTLRAEQATFLGCLVKPFNERELRAAIEVAFYTHHMERTLADERARRHAAEELKAEWQASAQALRESEEMFRLLVDEVRDYAIFLLDPQGHVMTWNAGAERIKGYRADEIIGQSFVRFYLPKEVIAGVPSSLLRQATQHGVASHEGVRVRKDGSLFWASVVITALHDKAGLLRGFAKVTRDITEQRNAQQYMTLLADASRVLAESIDSEQILFAISHMVVPMFADGVLIHTRDPNGQPRLELFHAANVELVDAIQKLQRRGAFRVAAPSRRVMQTGRSELHPTLTPEWLRRQQVDDEVASLIRWFGISSTIHVAINWAGRPRAVIVFASLGTRVYNDRDLVFAEELARRVSTAMQNAELFHNAKTERERAEEEVTLRERLVTIVGHDLRAPLSAISEAAQTLTSHVAPAGEHFLGRILRSANRMMRMIDEILDFARIRARQGFDLRLESADLRQLCQVVVDEVRVSKPEQEIKLSAEGETFARVDSDRIAQLLSNLIGNAIQHGKAGPVDVTVHAAAPDSVAIDVHNLGPPIPRTAQSHLFEAFRWGVGTGDDQASMGLGLFIAHEIVRAHQGSIAVRSPDRNGTTFSVVLPRRTEAAG